MASLTFPLGKLAWLEMLGPLSTWSLLFRGLALLIQGGTMALSAQEGHAPVGKHFSGVCYCHTC